MKPTGDSFNCIAIDMGAGSIRVMLGSVSPEGISVEEIHRFENEIRVHEGRDTWDMDRMIREIRAGVARAIEASEYAPVSIGVDSWGVDYVLLDAHGELVDTPVAYRDKRTEGMQELWASLMPEAETFKRTGINFYVFNTLFQLLSIRGSKALQRCSRILFMPCYINYLLSGRQVNELTIASTSQMLEVLGDQWDEDILGKLGLEEAKLGKVVKPGTLLGQVTLPEAGDLKIENVAVCGHDTACVVAAIPVENPHYAFISAGTWCIVGVESERPLISDQALALGITNERGYGNSYRSLKNIVGLWLLQGLKKQLSPGISFAQMEEMVSEEADISQVIDPDDPLFYNPSSMKEAFDAYFGKTGQSLPGRFSDYLRSAYDSLCFSFRFHIEQLERLSGRSIAVLHLVGGGSQSDYLCQRVATLCKREVVSGPVEGASMGNILIQGMAMGRIRNLEEGRQVVRQSCRVKKYKPGSLTESLENRYRKYLTLKNIE
jgi:sugar (pentulose or hexulose) kinase